MQLKWITNYEFSNYERQNSHVYDMQDLLVSTEYYAKTHPRAWAKELAVKEEEEKKKKAKEAAAAVAAKKKAEEAAKAAAAAAGSAPAADTTAAGNRARQVQQNRKLLRLLRNRRKCRRQLCRLRNRHPQCRTRHNPSSGNSTAGTKATRADREEGG